MTDPVSLTVDLVRCPSVTPEEGGALTLLENLLGEAGFVCTRMPRNGVDNLHARYGNAGPVLGFNGHTDVVPVGGGWTVEPFGGTISDGKLWGRGACDMKSGVAAFICAALGYVRENPEPDGSLAILITGDEEGPGVDGTQAILDWMERNGETLDHCIVGEPTCPDQMGEMIKIGRRGSMTVYLTATGVQGHAAYPHRARNPLPPLLGLLDRMARWRLDEGTEQFDPSTLSIVTVDTGNPANNVIPGEARATVNIRFNDAHSSDSLSRIIQDMIAGSEVEGVNIAMETSVSGESFVTEPDGFTRLVQNTVATETGIEPVLSTSGGTSDARFIRRIAPVLEFGLVGQSMHKADEHVAVKDIETLERVYRRVIEGYFTGSWKTLA